MSDTLLQPESGSGFKWSERSKRNLSTVDPRMRLILNRALRNSDIDFAITEGKRSEQRQRELYARGRPDWRRQQGINLPEGVEDKPVTWTLQSRHLGGNAVDLLAFPDGQKGSWNPEHYKRIARHVKKAAEELGYKIRWGGDFKKSKDWVHFELVPD